MNFSESLSQYLGISLSAIVIVFAARNLIPFQLGHDPILPLLSFFLIAASSILVKFRRPSRSDIMPFIPVFIIAITEIFYLAKFPIFPYFFSGDLISHAKLATDYANGFPTPFSAQILDYGVEYLLSIPLMLRTGEAFMTNQYMMAILTILSPYFVYLSMLRLFENHRMAWMTSLLYSLSGVLIFGLVFDSALFPTFYSVLASLFLIAASIGFVREKVGVSTTIILLVAYVNALFSHYSILFLIPVLAVYSVLKARQQKMMRNGYYLVAIFVLPLAIGAMIFQGMVSQFLKFFAGGGAQFFGYSPLGEFIGSKSLNYLIVEANSDWLALLFFGCLAVFALFCMDDLIVSAEKRPLHKNPRFEPYHLERWLLFGWLLFITLLTPQSDIAWRFTFIAFIPLYLIAGYVMARPLTLIKRLKDADIKQLSSLILVSSLFVFPVFVGSWTAFAVTEASSPYASTYFYSNQTQTMSYAQTQRLDWQAMQWLGDHAKGANVVSLTDYKFNYATRLFDIPVNFAQQDRVLYYDFNQAFGYAVAANAKYIVITKYIDINAQYPASVPRCQKTIPIIITANQTEIRTGHNVELNITTTPRINLEGYIVVGNDSTRISLRGSTTVDYYFKKAGDYQAYVAFPPVITNTLSLHAGNSSNAVSAAAGVPPDYCLPWTGFTPIAFGGKMAYQNENVKIICIRKDC